MGPDEYSVGDGVATGKIMALSDFTNANMTDRCILNNCLVDIEIK